MVEFLERIDQPKTWPKWLRRLYVCTFPLAVPFHMLLLVWAAVISIVAMAVLGTIIWFHDVWTGDEKS